MTAKTVLAVDDSRCMRDMMAFTLTQAGYTVLQAESMTDALRLMDYNRTDCVVTDLGMPNGDGLELLKQIRASSDHKSVPVLVLSDEANDIKKQAGRNAGVHTWLDKPFQPAALTAAVKKACS